MIEQELPPKYYLSYFEYLLDFVQEKYGTLLNKKEKSFIKKFNLLNEDSKCLYLRFANRKHWLFKTNNLAYSEIEDIEKCLVNLKKKKFIEDFSVKKHVDLYPSLLNLLTKPELLSFANEVPKSTSKADLVEHCLTKKNKSDLLLNIPPIIKANFEQEVTFLRFLFFGNRYMDMSEFVVRDLGFINYYPQHEDHLVARFSNRKEAEDKWYIADQSELFKGLKQTATVSEINNWFLNVLDHSKNISKVAKPALDSLTIKIGRFFEQKKEYTLAIALYKYCLVSPARERSVRCFFYLKDFEAAKELCKEMLKDYQNADEQIFANDFLARLEGKKIKSTTELLKKADSINISPIYKGQVEQGAIEHYLENNMGAIFSENHTWRAIFGLVFWDIIFDPELIVFHHPFQRRPSDLHLPEFYKKRKETIIRHLDSFTELDHLLIFMGTQFERNLGIANVFVLWVENMWETISLMVRKIGLEKIKLILHKIAENIVENSRGFPDLFVWGDEEQYELVEIKSPTDSLSNQQLFWLNFFEEHEINARVLKVNFNS